MAGSDRNYKVSMLHVNNRNYKILTVTYQRQGQQNINDKILTVRYQQLELQNTCINEQ